MSARTHSATGERRESSRAWQAWLAYRSLPAGERSLERLCAQFKEQAARHQTTPASPPPPTTNLDSLKRWSAQWGWQQRLAVQEAEQEYARKAEMQRQIEAQAAEDAQLLHGVGSGALAVAAVLLNQLVDARTGQLKGPLQARDLGVLARVGVDCLMAARGDSPQGGDPNAPLRKLLEQAPEDTRRMVIQAMRAMVEWREQHERQR